MVTPFWWRWIFVKVLPRQDNGSVWSLCRKQEAGGATAGFARGFCVLSEHAEIQYKCTGIYNSNAESGIRWTDPKIGIDWAGQGPSTIG
jgi:hypothetical protein